MDDAEAPGCLEEPEKRKAVEAAGKAVKKQSRRSSGKGSEEKKKRASKISK